MKTFYRIFLKGRADIYLSRLLSATQALNLYAELIEAGAECSLIRDDGKLICVS